VQVAVRCDTLGNPRSPDPNPATQPLKIRWEATPYFCGLGLCPAIGVVIYHGYCYSIVTETSPTDSCAQFDPTSGTCIQYCWRAGGTRPIVVPRTDLRAASAVEVNRTELECLGGTCNQQRCLIPMEPASCCNRGVKCSDLPSIDPGLIGCIGCDCDCGTDFTYRESGFITGEELATSIPCVPNQDQCTGRFCDSNVGVTAYLAWDFTIRYRCDGALNWTAQWLSQEFRSQWNRIIGVSGCDDAGPVSNNYIGPINAFGPNERVPVSSTEVPQCGHFTASRGYNINIPYPVRELCPNCTPFAMVYRATDTVGLPPFARRCAWNDTLGSGGECSDTGNDSGTIFASCTGGTITRRVRYGETPCPTLSPGGDRVRNNGQQTWSFTPNNRCGPVPVPDEEPDPGGFMEGIL